MPRRHASIQELLPLDDIVDDIAVLRDGGHCAVVEVSGVHFALRSEAEQEVILAGFRRLLNALSHPVQLLVRVVPADVERYLAGLGGAQLAPELRGLRRSHEEFVRRIAGERAVLERRFYVVVPGEDASARAALPRVPWRRARVDTGDGLAAARRRLRFRCGEMAQAFAGFGVPSQRLGGEALIALWRDCLGAPASPAHTGEGRRRDA